jgi:hypothetical protein
VPTWQHAASPLRHGEEEKTAGYRTLLHVKYIIILLSTEVDNIASAKEKKHHWLRIYDRLSPSRILDCCYFY